NNRSVVTDHIMTRLLRYRFVILTKKTTVQTKSKPAANRCPICTHTSKRFENINESGELFVQKGQSTHAKLASTCRTSAPVYTTINRSEEHTSELLSRFDLVCRLLLEKKNRACISCLLRVN